MRLLPLEEFDKIFLPFQNKVIQFVTLYGNVGDALLNEATEQLFKHYKINYFRSECKISSRKCDEIVIAAGGNMGDKCPYKGCRDIRHKAYATDLPITILPQTFFSAEQMPDRVKVYVREKTSLQFCPKAELAPDMALGYDYDAVERTRNEVGVFMRSDGEATTKGNDPARLVRTPRDYLWLANGFEKIYTNRLHFAISGLICKREVFLLPGNYHKNRSVWEAWLNNLGCKWAEKVP